MREVLKGVVIWAMLPGLVVWLVLVGIGWVIMGPLHELPAEEAITNALAAGRSPAADAVTHVSSTGNDTWWTIGTAVVFAGALWLLTHRWWTAIVPLLAITLESSIFVTATHVVDRPRPQAMKLDPAPPTSSFPSGHSAAAFALYISMTLLAQRIRTPWLRWTVTVAGILIPIGVSFSRLYRGMHHLTDVLIGILLGVWCAFASVWCIRANQREYLPGVGPQRPAPPVPG